MPENISEAASQKDNMIDAVSQAIESPQAFGDLLTPEQREFLLDRGVVRSVMPGEVLCEQGQQGDYIYIIVVGEVEVSKIEGNAKVILAHLNQNEVFGEISALYQEPRVSSVTVSKPSVLLEIHASSMNQIMHDNAELRSAIIERYKKRLTTTTLRALPALRLISDEQLADLVEKSSLLGIPANNTIVEEGEPGDAVYVIVFGEARVSHKFNQAEINLSTLHPGNYFGEWSVLTGAPRAATVMAVTPVELVRIDRLAFLDFIQANPEVRDRIDLDAVNRRDATQKLDKLTNDPNAPSGLVELMQDYTDIMSRL